MTKKHIVLVSKKPIVIQIFKLVCNKLDIKLDILQDSQIDNKVDIIVMDTDFIDDRFNSAKPYAKLMGAISKVELPFEIANDFIIPIPFLPSNLEDILQTQFNIIKERENKKVYVKNIDQSEDKEDEDIDEVEASLDYIDNLANDIGSSIIDEPNSDDESIVKVEKELDGGVLDKNQLDEIGDLLDPHPELTNSFVQEEPLEDENWQDLASIVDQAINEANTINGIAETVNKIVDVKLNDYQLEQLTPLLNILDQDILDQLTQGEEIRLNLKFENEDE
jgi:hypothetical protein